MCCSTITQKKKWCGRWNPTRLWVKNRNASQVLIRRPLALQFANGLRASEKRQEFNRACDSLLLLQPQSQTRLKAENVLLRVSQAAIHTPVTFFNFSAHFISIYFFTPCQVFFPHNHSAAARARVLLLQPASMAVSWELSAAAGPLKGLDNQFEQQQQHSPPDTFAALPASRGKAREKVNLLYKLAPQSPTSSFCILSTH